MFFFSSLTWCSGAGAGQCSGAAVQPAGLPHRAAGRAVGPHPQLHQPAAGATRTCTHTGVEADTICYEAGAAAAFPNTACLLLGFSVAALFISSPDWETDVKTEPWAPVDLSSSCETLSFSPSAVYYSWLRFCPHVQTQR